MNQPINARKKFYFSLIAVLISSAIILTILEFSGRLRLQVALKKELPVEVMRSMIDWVDYFHHHRGAEWLDQAPKPENLVFEVVKPGSNPILLQGDSWVQLMEIDPKSGAPLKTKNSVFFNNLAPSLKNLGYINAGVVSFAPSLADGQLRFLRERKDIDPSYIVFFMDQTDLGDEIYRYSKLLQKDGGALISINEDKYFQYKSQYQEIVRFNDARFKSIGLLQYELTKIGRKLFKDHNSIDVEQIVQAMANKLTPEQEIIVNTAISTYIQQALKSDTLKKLILVAHPHLRHLSLEGAYENNAHDFLLRAYKALPPDQKRRVCVGYVLPEKHYQFKDQRDVFRVSDPTSHLAPNFQFEQFPAALADVVNKCVF